jgi:surface polysaccharide O-acyltransferase-like enzyme
MVWLDNARVSAILAVVFLHAAANVVTGSTIGSEYWWIGNLYDSFVRWCVPVFVMISGALLLDPSKNEGLKDFYTKRMSRILVPILFWSAFFLLWGMVKGDPLSLINLAKKLLSGKPHYHMWFLYMIVTLYLFTPFFRKIIKVSSRNEIAVLVFFTFLIAVINAISVKLFPSESKLFINWFLSYIPFFFLGYLIRTDERNYSKPILWGVFLLSSLLTAVGCYFVARSKGLDAGLYFYGNLSITVIPMSVSIMYLLKSWTSPIGSERLTKTLSALTLGVYLIHPIVLETIHYLGLGPLNFYPAASIPIIALIGFTSSLIGALVIYQLPYIKRVI